MTRTATLWRLALCVASLLSASGCATRFAADPYYPGERSPATVANAKKVVLTYPFDRIDPEERKAFDPKFNPAAYLNDMFEQELAARKLAYTQAQFAFAPSFEGLADALAAAHLVPEDSVVLASAITWFPDSFHMSCDVKLYNHAGTLLFEKRGICINLRSVNPDTMTHNRDLLYFPEKTSSADVRVNRIRAARMVMIQIFADPDFQKALQ
jgi:hypothetical protein